MADIVKEMAVKFTARNEMSAATKQAADSLQNLQSKLTTLGRALAGGAITAGFMRIGRVISDNVKYFDDLDDASQRIGMSAKNYQTLGLAASFAGSDIDGAARAIDKLHKAIGDSIYTGKENEGLKRLGLTAKDFAGLDSYESFQKVSDATKKLGSVNLETAALMGVLGRGGAEQALVLRNLSEELQKAGQYTRNMITDEDIQKMADMSDKLEGMGIQLKNVLGNAIVGQIESAWGETDIQQFDRFMMAMGPAARRSKSKAEWREYWNDMTEAQEEARNKTSDQNKTEAAAAENLARIGGMADRIREAIQTPAEKMNEQIQQAKEALNTLDPSSGKSVLSQSEYDTYAKQLQEQFDKSDPATIERNKQIEEQRRLAEEYARQQDALAQQYTQANLTPNEKYIQEIARLNGLLNEGRMTWTAYARAVSAAGEQLNVASGAAARFSELEAYMQAGFESTRTPFEKYQIEMQKLNEAAAAGLGNPDLWNRIAWQAEQSLMDAMGNVASAMPQMMGGMGGYDMGMMAPPIGAYTQFFPGAGGGAPSTPGTAGMATASQIASIMTGGGASDTAKQQLSEAKRQTYLLERLAFSDGRGIIL